MKMEKSISLNIEGIECGEYSDIDIQATCNETNANISIRSSTNNKKQYINIQISKNNFIELVNGLNNLI